MIRSILIGLALGALALPAAAASVTVDLKADPQTVHARIAEAASSACSVEYRDASVLEKYYAEPECVSEAKAAAERKLAAKSTKMAKL
jgi:hypothetical protein